jgi:hypothetical protein
MVEMKYPIALVVPPYTGKALTEEDRLKLMGYGNAA